MGVHRGPIDRQHVSSYPAEGTELMTISADLPLNHSCFEIPKTPFSGSSLRPKHSDRSDGEVNQLPRGLCFSSRSFSLPTLCPRK